MTFGVDVLRFITEYFTTIMGYILYSLTFLFLLSGTGQYSVVCDIDRCSQPLVLYITRERWAHLLPIPDHVYERIHSSFSHDIESGFSSADFDLAANVAASDSRRGLDQRGKQEIQKIMTSRGVGFDEARRIYTERRFASNNIGADGRPRDPKFVSFS